MPASVFRGFSADEAELHLADGAVHVVAAEGETEERSASLIGTELVVMAAGLARKRVVLELCGRGALVLPALRRQRIVLGEAGTATFFAKKVVTLRKMLDLRCL
jgi:hypothetical protein